MLDWDALPPVQRIELMTTHDLAKREKQKLELLRSLLTYFHYASKETRPEVFRSEIERINGAVQKPGQVAHPALDEPTDVSLRWGNAEDDLGRHRASTCDGGPATAERDLRNVDLIQSTPLSVSKE